MQPGLLQPAGRKGRKRRKRRKFGSYQRGFSEAGLTKGFPHLGDQPQIPFQMLQNRSQTPSPNAAEPTPNSLSRHCRTDPKHLPQILLKKTQIPFPRHCRANPKLPSTSCRANPKFSSPNPAEPTPNSLAQILQSNPKVPPNPAEQPQTPLPRHRNGSTAGTGKSTLYLLLLGFSLWISFQSCLKQRNVL